MKTKYTISYVLLFIILMITENTRSQTRKDFCENIKADSFEEAILSKLKIDPLFSNYFKKAKNPSLSELAKTITEEEQIDSMVSVSNDTSFQIMKVSYEYDENGYLTNYITEYINNGKHSFGDNFSFIFRTDGQLESGIRLKWVDGNWKKITKETNTYDSNGDIITQLNESYDDALDNWINNSKYEYSYDARRNLTIDLTTTWVGGTWENNSVLEFAYDTENKKILEAFSRWQNGVWENYYINEYMYDANKNLVEVIISNWNNGLRKNDRKENYTYDTMNNKISSNEYLWSETTNSWNNNQWHLYNYDINGNETFEIFKIWDAATSNWVDQYRINSSYNASGKMILKRYETWLASSWKTDFESIYSFDSNDHLLSFTYYSNWDGNNWVGGDKMIYSYDSEGRCYEGTHKNWINNEWVNTDSDYLLLPEYWTRTEENQFWFYSIRGYQFSIYYTSITNINDSENIISEYKLSQNYPNPFNPTTTIKYIIPELEGTSHYMSVQLIVYDVLGKEVIILVNQKQSAGNYQVTFNAKNLSSGVYFYQLKTAENSITKKMLLLE